MDQRNGHPHNEPAAPTRLRRREPPTAEPVKGVIHQAAALLQEQHQVSDMVAFEMLVRGAADAGTSVREIAYAVLEGHPSAG